MPKRYPAEQRERATRMVLDRLDESGSAWAAAQALGPKLGVGDDVTGFANRFERVHMILAGCPHFAASRERQRKLLGCLDASRISCTVRPGSGAPTGTRRDSISKLAMCLETETAWPNAKGKAGRPAGGARFKPDHGKARGNDGELAQLDRQFGGMLTLMRPG